MRKDDSGQMHTLEGIMGAIVMIMVMVFVVQGTSITPLSSSSTNQHVQLELLNMGQDILTTLDYTDNPNAKSDLKKSIVTWNGMEYVWDGKRYVDVVKEDGSTVILDNELTRTLNFTLNSWGIAHNIEITYIDPYGNATSKKIIWNGNPSDNSISTSKVIALHNTDLAASPNFGIMTGIRDVDPSTDFYNLIDIKLTLWRM